MSDSANKRLYVHRDVRVTIFGSFLKWRGAIPIELHESDDKVITTIVAVDIPKAIPNKLGHYVIADFLEYNGQIRVLRGSMRHVDSVKDTIYEPFA